MWSRPKIDSLLAEAVAARGRQPNLSFFAFTATPKGRTLELFGEVGASGRHEPFHLYPMRQAIEEGFICDVLAGYVTYSRYYHLEKAILDDPAYDTAKARRALARFVTLHPDNLAQKVEIIVEHFRTKIARQIAGKAKAMVVCSSRPHAVRMWRALRAYAADLGYDLGVLVAFSGEVEGLTESRANGFGESQTAAKFDTDRWQIMVVAEKFQTGFDQPKLAAMYVDKTLTGLAAVQTLSRLNRIHPDKSATFVMDFVNDAEEIGEAFAVYHGKTVAPPTDPTCCSTPAIGSTTSVWSTSARWSVPQPCCWMRAPTGRSTLPCSQQLTASRGWKMRTRTPSAMLSAASCGYTGSSRWSCRSAIPTSSATICTAELWPDSSATESTARASTSVPRWNSPICAMS